MSSKKAQLGMMEMFVILIVIFIIIGFGMYFFFKMSTQSTKGTAEELCLQTATDQLSWLPNIPELVCSEQAHTETYCIDVFKAMAYRYAADKSALYAANCPKKVVIEQVYPAPRTEDKECDLVRQNIEENCNYMVLYETSDDVSNLPEKIVSTPISLYYPHIDEYRIGRLIISTYT